MKNVIFLNGETYVKVDKLSCEGLFTQVYYVNRKRKNESVFHRGIPFLRYDDAVAYKQHLEDYLDMTCHISSICIYTRSGL